MGYHKSSKYYRLYILEKRYTIVIRDVNFEEEASKKSHEPILVIYDEE